MTEQLSLLADVDDGRPTPPDQPQRDRIRDDLATTLFVEAGAGSGKTTALVDRIISLVGDGTALENIAAITFTEKAAAELRQRVRERLEELLRRRPGERVMRDALHQLDGAAISTLHAFAQRLLFEHPIEAGLPPGVEVLDELASQVDFDDRWETWIPQLLADPDAAAPLLVGDVLRIGLPALRGIAHQFENNWDLLAERLPETLPPLDVDVDGLVERLRAVAGHAVRALDGADKLASRLDEVAEHAAALEATAHDTGLDDVDRLVDLAELLSSDEPKFMTASNEPYRSLGAKTRWPADEDLDAIKSELWEAGMAREEVRARLAQAVIAHLANAVAGFVLESVEQRRTEGRLRFHDLLVLARDMLRDPERGPHVRRRLRDRYQRLLIDEFQDTDPIQVDLASLIAATDGLAEEVEGADRGPTPGAGSGPETTTSVGLGAWDQVACSPGRLFFVGDPKQSIYRFRRADIATYLRAQSHFGGPHGSVSLTTNFRSTAPVVDWVNHVFGGLIVAEEDSQPAYTPLRSVREAVSTGPGVLVLGEPAHRGSWSAGDLRTAEARDVADTVVEAVSAGWAVSEKRRDGTRVERSARLGDITILLPARTSLPALERALEDANIAYRAETASLVYATQEVRDLLMIARAIDDPTDELAVVAALRTAGLGCGDDDLYRYRHEHRGGWNHQHLREDLPADHVVVEGMTWLGAMHQERPWLSPAQLLDRIARERRLLQLGVCQLRHREVWRRLRFVIDQARAWTDATGGDLRQYLAWVHLQGSDSARVAETVLPETDTDAVRIMTIHASKGLEFPITIVSGLTTQVQGRTSEVRVVWPPEGGIGYRIGKANTTPEYDQFVPLDEQMDAHERLRLLYVACTRAGDHLVVSLHRAEQQRGPTLAQLVAAHAVTDPDDYTERRADDDRWVRPPALGVTRRLPDEAAAHSTAPEWLAESWAQARAEAVAGAGRSRTVAATTLARLAAAEAGDDPGLAKAGRDLDLPPWQKGRYGTSIGRAVHGVLQTIDLATGAGVAAAASAQAAAEGVLGSEDEIEARCRAAIASEIVQAAAASRHWREIFVAAPIGDRLLEGYVDLLYESSDGLVVVDYKTDAWDDDEDLDAKVDRYRVQAAAYAVAVEAATAREVRRAVLLFAATDVAVARDIPDLSAAKAAVRSLMPSVVAGGEEESAGA